MDNLKEIDECLYIWNIKQNYDEINYLNGPIISNEIKATKKNLSYKNLRTPWFSSEF